MDDTVANELKDQAIEWFTRFRAENVSEAERQRHDSWLKQDRAHRQAYRDIENEWQQLDQLDSWAKEELGRLEKTLAADSAAAVTRGYRWWGFRFAAFAAVAALMAVVILPFVYPFGLYQTDAGEQRKVVLEDGSRVHLNALTSIDVRFNNSAREIVLLSGEALFDVAHETTRPFIVKARNSQVIAVGTSFRVYYKRDSVDVTVIEGQVAVVPKEVATKPLIKRARSVDGEYRKQLLQELSQVGVFFNARSAGYYQ